MYPVIDPQANEPAHIHVATTRPETMLGDTAVAVHPDPAAALDRVASELRKKLKSATAAEKESVQAEIDALAARTAATLPKLELLRDMAVDWTQAHVAPDESRNPAGNRYLGQA